MDLQSLTAQIDDLSSAPPFDKWDPPFCGDIDMCIKGDGRWFYMGSPIGRMPLVKLFASVLVYEPKSNEYFLKTPAEKVRIQVEDAPFLITEWYTSETDEGPAVVVTTNLGKQVVLSDAHPLLNFSATETKEPDDNEPRLYVEIERGLQARVHRNVFYQWVNDDKGLVFERSNQLHLRSGGKNFLLGGF